MIANYLHKTVPFQHQEKFMEWAYFKEYIALMASVGTGKSKMLIDLGANRYAEGTIEAMMIIAPSNIVVQWAEEQLMLHCPIPYKTYLYQAGCSKKKDREYKEFLAEKGVFKILITNTEIFSRDTYVPELRSFLQANKTFLVIDESHYIKSLEALRTQNIIYGLSDITRLGKRVVASRPLSAFRAVASGTMVANSPTDLFSVMSFLKPDYFGMTFSSFKSRYSLEKTDRVPGTGKIFKRKLSIKEMKAIRDAHAKGMRVDRIMELFAISQEDIRYLVEHPDLQKPYKHLDELKQIIRPDAFIIKAEDCLDMPDKIYEKVLVELSSEQKKLYRDLVKNLETELRGQELTVQNSLSLLIRLSQVTANLYPLPNGEAASIVARSPKVEMLLDLIEEHDTFPALIVSRFVGEVREAVSALRERFPERTIEYIVGEVGEKEREDIKRRYKAGDVDLLVATPGTISVGLNLQRASTIYFLSNDYSYVTREQTEGRVYRAGQESDKCTFVDIIAKGTIDERVYSVLLEKQELLEYMRSTSLSAFLGSIKG